MSFIIIERHGGADYAIIVIDENSNNLVFDSREEAEAEAGLPARYYCRIILELPGSPLSQMKFLKPPIVL